MNAPKRISLYLERYSDNAERGLAGIPWNPSTLGNAFWHLGDFSVGYRRAFGEAPSETLREAVILRARSRIGEKARSNTGIFLLSDILLHVLLMTRRVPAVHTRES
ncbi:hypothetical protein QY049_06735 [Bradyrhizobium sp. WYCCWR 13022]|uniref:hypothetical protein n=1 Tax=Bradyrhizobium TaxID=374 RepID=UPI002163172D|nr:MULTISPECIES: hypothetical protein [Bradyrhizobium]MDN4982925.1 hypothetical protein [Bradyrhizobium sp. WYCCWR 13022]